MQKKKNNKWKAWQPGGPHHPNNCPKSYCIKINLGQEKAWDIEGRSSRPRLEEFLKRSHTCEQLVQSAAD